jgi:hypothetical protein
MAYFFEISQLADAMGVHRNTPYFNHNSVPSPASGAGM